MKKYIGQPKMIKKINNDLIKDIILKNGPISKPEVAKITKLSLPTVNKIVESMVQEGILNKLYKDKSQGGGRKPFLYEFNGEIGYVIALYIENEYSNGYIKGALVDLLGNIIYKEDRKIKYNMNKNDTNNLFNFINVLISKAKNKESIKAISIGIPGVVDDKGKIYKIPNIPKWEGINLKDIIQKTYNISTFIENDVNLTAIGIFHKELNSNYENIIYMYFGEGIGSGIILGNKLYKGKTNFAGEIANMVIKTPDDSNLEKYKSKGLFGHEYLKIIEKIINDKKIKELLLINPESKEIYENNYVILLIEKISYVIINMILLLNPEVVIIRGPIFNNYLLSKMEDKIASYIGVRNCPKLMISKDSEIGLEGAVRLGLSNVRSNYSLINNKGV